MNRVIKDSIWSSRSLAKLCLAAQLHWPRWLLMADDWGCFNADTEIIKGLVYPKLKAITLGIIEKLKDEYFNSGKLFLWSEGDRQYGFFTSWSNHQFCNATHQDDDGKQNRHKRKTPEPPQELLEEYLTLFKEKQPLTEELERVRTCADKYRIPNPIPNHNHNPKESVEITKLFFGEHRNVRLTREESDKLKAIATPFDLKREIEDLSDYIKTSGKAYKSHYATLRSWLRKKGLLREPKKENKAEIEEERIQRIYYSAVKNAPPDLYPGLEDAWRSYHEKYPKMGWDKLLKERGVEI